MTLINDDCFNYFKNIDTINSHIITGLPDMKFLESKSNNLENYKNFVKKFCNIINNKINDDVYVIFFQTDRKYNKKWIDKSYLISECLNMTLLWHKIYLNRDPGKINLHRPGYSHILCYSKNCKPGKTTCDVLPFIKKNKSHKNATPNSICDFLCKFISIQSKNKNILDPFAGRCSIYPYCKKYGLQFIGIEIDKNECVDLRIIQ